MSDYKVNRKHKDSLFRMIFSEGENSRKRLLELYNALNNTSYDNPDDLTITTLSDVIYMKMKNDISFLIDNRMTLFEHQSTYNPNMPLRGFLYFANLYQAFVADYPDLNIYGSKLIKIPTPQYIVFYNGSDKRLKGERVKLRLSDAFEHEIKTGDFEWTAQLIDINYGANKELMDKCVTLKHYSIFVDKVKRYNKESKDLTKAIDKTVDECISEGILADFLLKMKSEVRNVLLEEFDEEQAIKSWNYAMDKMQTEIKQYKNEIEQYHNEIENFKNKIITINSENDKVRFENDRVRSENDRVRSENDRVRSENDRVRSENRNNILQTVSLLRELGKDDSFITQTLIEKYNVSKESVSDYL